MTTPNRNDPCPCGSGKKYKKCHMALNATPSPQKSGSAATDKLSAAEQAFGTGLWGQAETLCRQALAVQPGNAQTAYLLGLALAAQSRLADAIPAYLTAIQNKKGFFQAMGNLGHAYQALGRNQEAETILRQAISEKVAIGADEAFLYNNLGNALLAQGKHSDAQVCFQTAIAKHPNLLQAHYNLGNVFLAQQDYASAIPCFQLVFARNPQSTEALNNLGLAFFSQGKVAEAMDCYQKSLALNPHFPEAHYNIARALQDQQRLDEAIAHYNQAIQCNPAYAEAYCNLGGILAEQDRYEEAIKCLRTAISIAPRLLQAYNNLNLALSLHGKIDEAIQCCEQAILLAPDAMEAYSNLAHALKAQGRLKEALDCYERAISRNPNHIEAYSGQLFAMQFDPQLDTSALQHAYQRFQALFELPLQPYKKSFHNTPDANRKLRIGYISPDFRRHAVAYFIEPILAHHDKDAVEVFCYYNHVRHDAYTNKLRDLSSHWLDCHGLSDAQLADRIREDGIDILVDLAGHLASNRLLVLARKPAPIQMTYLGYPGSTGLMSVDYRITDNYADADGSEVYYTEKLLRLPGSLWCYRPHEEMPEVTPLPALRNGYLTFGSFNAFNKIGQDSIALWAKLLHEIPDARIVLGSAPEGAARTKVREQFASLGVNTDRLSFVGLLSTSSFHRAMQEVDIALDPVVVNGATTTCEALWLGVPTLSLVGRRFLSRAGFSLLSNAGIPEFAASTEDELIAVARYYTLHISELATLRQALPARAARSSLADGAGFTRRLETLYRQAWATWCQAATPI